MQKLPLMTAFIFFFAVAAAQKIESPFNEFTVSINRTQSAGNTVGFGFGAYHSPKNDSTKGAVIGIEYNHTIQYYEHLRYYHHWESGEKNVIWTFDFFALYAAYRAANSKNKLFADLGGFFDIGISSTKKGKSYWGGPYPGTGEVDKNYGTFGIFPGLSFAFGVRVPVAKLQLIIKPECKLFLSSFEDNRGKSFLLSYFRLAIGVKYF